MNSSNREKLIDCLYRRCRVRTATSKEVFDGLVSDLGLCGTKDIEQQALDIIRPYKNTGTKLESTADALYAILYPNDDTQRIAGWMKYES